MIDNLSIAVQVLPMRLLTSLSVDEILLPAYMNWFTNFCSLPINEEMAPSWLNKKNSFWSEFSRDQCLLLPAPGYVAQIRLDQIYLE